MNEPSQLGLFEDTHPINHRKIICVPPDRLVMKEFAYLACVNLKGKRAARNRQIISSGLADFLDFIAHASAKYLNNGERAYLLDGYAKPNQKK